jgi:dipeptidyl aminopeptidase/acylaminoacyl peptidase
VSGSEHTFTMVSWSSPLFWLTRGYAVLDGCAMPIVGEGEQKENDNYVEQIQMNAAAAVAALQQRGVSDHRLAVGGHSYGAFMTANLLARTRLFCAGIARSGAYNRQLTPFGFQSEERNFWEVADADRTPPSLVPPPRKLWEGRRLQSNPTIPGAFWVLTNPGHPNHILGRRPRRTPRCRPSTTRTR